MGQEMRRVRRCGKAVEPENIQRSFYGVPYAKLPPVPLSLSPVPPCSSLRNPLTHENGEEISSSLRIHWIVMCLRHAMFEEQSPSYQIRST